MCKLKVNDDLEFSLKWKSEINLPRISKRLNLIFLPITHNLVIQKHDQKSKRIIFQSLTLQYQACRHQFLTDQLTLSQPGGCRVRLCPPNDTGTPRFSYLPTFLNTITQIYLNFNSTFECPVLTNNVSLCSSFIPLGTQLLTFIGLLRLLSANTSIYYIKS